MSCFKKLLRIICLALSLLLISGTCVPVFAADVQTGSIACLNYIDGEKAQNVKCELWRVANYDRDANRFELLPEYDRYHIQFDPGDVDVMARFAKTLHDYIRRDNVHVYASSVSDSQGIAQFDFLPPGVYLVSSGEFERGGFVYAAQPALVYLPNLLSSGDLSFSAEIELKFSGHKIPVKPSEHFITRRVLKTWFGDDESDRPDEISVELLRNGKVYDTVSLSAKNSWRYVWDDLSSDFDWSVVEASVPDGYETHVDKQGITFVVENTRVSETPSGHPWEPPVVPSDPGSGNTTITPADPWNPPVTPVAPPKTPVVPNDPKIPQTGQLWWPVPVLTIVGLLVMLGGVFRKRENGFVGIIVFTGVVFVLAALGLTMYNLYEDDVVRENTPVADMIVRPANLDVYDDVYVPDYQLDESFAMPVTEVENRSYIGRIDIDAIGVSLPVQSEFTYANLKVSPVLYIGSVYDGTCVIGAHNYNSHFGRLKSLDVGDELCFTDMDGNVFSYRVTGLETLNGGDVAGLCAGDWDLTLFTCTYGGRSRVVVRCACIDGLDFEQSAAV